MFEYKFWWLTFGTVGLGDALDTTTGGPTFQVRRGEPGIPGKGRLSESSSWRTLLHPVERALGWTS